MVYNDLLTGLPHCLVSVVGPTHPVLQGPPCMQALVRVIVPVPHCTEQGPKGPQAPIRDGAKVVKKNIKISEVCRMS